LQDKTQPRWLSMKPIVNDEAGESVQAKPTSTQTEKSKIDPTQDTRTSKSDLPTPSSVTELPSLASSSQKEAQKSNSILRSCSNVVNRRRHALNLREHGTGNDLGDLYFALNNE
jgi:hypothetical protein